MLATYFVDPPFFCIDPHQWKIWYLVMEVQFSLKKMCLQGESIRIRRYVQTTMIVGMPKRKKKENMIDKLKFLSNLLKRRQL